jgi:uncharacterized protein (DUF1697 family)
MARYVAFLRGINLGKRRPPMAQLKQLFEELGFTDVATFIASGNVIFATKAQDTARLAAKIARHLEQALGYDVDTFVRRAEDVVAIGRLQAFADQDAPGVTVHVNFLAAPLGKGDAARLERIRTPIDEFRVVGQEFYWLCRKKILESTVWQSPEMKALKLPSSTMRNLTSVRKLIAKHLTE